MATLIDKATICNWALNEIGEEPSYVVGGEDELSQTVDMTWQRVIDRCLALHPWADFRKTYRLARLAEAPETGWKYAFELPGERIGEPLRLLQAVGECEQLLRNYGRESSLVLTNAENVWARVRVYRDPETWDEGWRAAFVVALAAHLAVPVMNDQDLRVELLREAFGNPSEGGAGGMFGRLIAQDMAGAPLGSPVLDNDPLTSAHTAIGNNYPWHGRW